MAETHRTRPELASCDSTWKDVRISENKDGIALEDIHIGTPNNL